MEQRAAAAAAAAAADDDDDDACAPPTLLLTPPTHTLTIPNKKKGEARQLASVQNCEGVGVYKYLPRKGDAVVFYDLKPDLEIDPQALHAGCPVKRGTKWVATKWLHDKPLREPLDDVGVRIDGGDDDGSAAAAE